MTRRPARQRDPYGAAEPSAEDGRSRVDSWIAAAVAKEAGAVDPRGFEDYDALVEATAASERRAIETAARTAAALGSVASWIERAQEQLTESARAATRAQDDAAAVLHDAVETLGTRIGAVERKVVGETSAAEEALRAIERLEGRLTGEARPAPADPRRFAPEPAPPVSDGRRDPAGEPVASTARPGRREPRAAQDEIRSAVAEILSHQARLDRETAGPSAQAASPASLPALGTLARSQTALLGTMRAEAARLADRPAARNEPSTAGPAAVRPVPASEGPATRADLDRLERGIRSLTSDIAELRAVDRQAGASAGLASLQAEIRRLAEQRPAPEPTHGLETLSHKLDLVAASGVDPTLVTDLARQVEDVRRLLTGAAAPQALEIVTTHLDDLRREVAVLGDRQAPPDAIASLQSAMDEIRTSLGSVRAPAPERDVARLVREAGAPLETMLASLADKIDRVERRIADPDALDHLQAQIEALAARLGQAPAAAPGLEGLERSITGLVGEVATWRDGAIEAAERAARLAVAETVGAMPVAQEVEQHLSAMRDHYALAEARTTESLAAVHDALESVMRRMSGLETRGGIGPEPEPSTRQGRAAAGRRAAPAEAPAPLPRGERAAERGSRTEAASVQDDVGDVLLEPGAGRPRGGRIEPAFAGREAPAEADPSEIRSSFIAAARRAAQAAAAETAAAPSKKARPPRAEVRDADEAAPSAQGGILQRLRRMLDERRRPLLLGAAALVLAIGTLQMARSWVASSPAPASPTVAAAPATSGPVASGPSASRPAAPEAPVRPAPADAPAGRPPLPDPLTTQSLGERAPARSGERLPADGIGSIINPSTERPAPRTGEAAPAVAPTLPLMAAGAAGASARAPAAPDPAANLPVGLRQAAANGNPVALFDLGVRTGEGRGVARDPKAALALLEKAADKGLAPAQYRVGNIYERGVGVPRDLDLARTWYRRAAESGNVRAMHNLAVLIAEGGGGKPDYPTAIGWFTKAANFGVKDSQFNLAVLHARGLGTPVDLGKSYLWLALAGQQGDEDAGRKRDEVGGRLSPADLVKAKAEVARWRPAAPDPAANDVRVPAEGWPDAPVKRASRDTRTY